MQNNYIKTLSTLHTALLVGQIFFAGIMLLLIYRGGITPAMVQNSQFFLIASLLATAIGFVAGHTLYTKKINAIKENDANVSVKLSQYRSANILRWAIFEGVAYLTIIFFFLTAEKYIIILCAVMMTVFFTTRPSMQKVCDETGLNESDIE
jgi:hypothetical protein